MIKLLIVDDEPLVQIGLKSMLDWEELGIEVCGVASNGDTAFEMVESLQPEIVITDIQMPCSSGLDLAGKCRETFGDLPVFIILTSFEEFEYAQTALRFQAIDYLVKLDLTPALLERSVQKALEKIRLYQEQHQTGAASSTNLLLFRERFFSKLLNNLFETREQFQEEVENLALSFDSSGYVAAQMEVVINQLGNLNQEQVLKTYGSTVQMFRELIQRRLPCEIVVLDTRFFAAVFFIDDAHKDTWKSYLEQALESTFSMLYNYYSVTILSSIGRLVREPLALSSSYYDARQLISYLSTDQKLMYFEDQEDSQSLRNVFNLSLFRQEIRKAFEELDEAALHDIFTSVIEVLPADQKHYPQALDVAGSILHLATTLLTDGQEIASKIFETDQDGYHSLYRQKNVIQITAWLRTLEDGLCQALSEQKATQKNFLVENTKKYICAHLHERLMLQDIAAHFNVSPNHLSQLFKRVTDMGITEYITNQKIEESKKLLTEGTLKVYEVADQLGFESAFYFSKVFKKITGISPKDYRNREI